MAVHPITTMQQLAVLNEVICIAGYRAGRAATPDHTQRDGAYWHSYLNGQVDGGHAPISYEQQELARVYVASQRGR